MAGKKKNLWFGFLEAGAKGSPVVRDTTLTTGNPRTVFLFNFMKEKILEYQLVIVEPKLRELTAEELTLVPELRRAFQSARESFLPRPVVSRRSVARARTTPPADVFSELGDGDDLDETNLPVLDDDDGVDALFLD